MGVGEEDGERVQILDADLYTIRAELEWVADRSQGAFASAVARAFVGRAETACFIIKCSVKEPVVTKYNCHRWRPYKPQFRERVGRRIVHPSYPSGPTLPPLNYDHPRGDLRCMIRATKMICVVLCNCGCI